MKRLKNAKAEKEFEPLRARERPPTADELIECLQSILRVVEPHDYAWAIHNLARVVAELQQQQVSKRGPGRPRRDLSELKYNEDNVTKAYRDFLEEHNTPAALKRRERVNRKRPVTTKGFENVLPFKNIWMWPKRSDIVRAILKSRNLEPPLCGSDEMAKATNKLDYDLKACGTNWLTIVYTVGWNWFVERLTTRQ